MDAHERRRRKQFGIKAFLAATAVVALVAGLFFPRFGDPLDGCADQGLQSVWIAPPEDADIVRKCKDLLCQRKDATVAKIPVSNAVSQAATVHFLQRAAERGIPVVDQTS